MMNEHERTEKMQLINFLSSGTSLVDKSRPNQVSLQSAWSCVVTDLRSMRNNSPTCKDYPVPTAEVYYNAFLDLRGRRTRARIQCQRIVCIICSSSRYDSSHSSRPVIIYVVRTSALVISLYTNIDPSSTRQYGSVVSGVFRATPDTAALLCISIISLV